MPHFGNTSQGRLDTCHPDLKRLFEEVILHFDCAVLCGHRTEAEQTDVFSRGMSKVEWPNSKHNGTPSKAVDVAPYPINWSDKERFYYFAGIVKGIAIKMRIDIRWGGDWDSDTEVSDQTFMDLPHFELR